MITRKPAASGLARPYYGAFAFGPFRLIPSQHVLLRERRPVKLGGRALDILHLLLMRAGEEVSKKTLIEFAWPNVFVDEANLKVHVSSLRRALEDTLPQATYIATVAGRGYQFIGEVKTEGVEVAGLCRDDQPVVCSLPTPPTLIGRQRDVEGVARALDFARLVTLVGPGGVGKTSLAIAVAHMRQDEFPEGVHFVDLTATDDLKLVPHLVATCLGVRGDPADLISAVVQHLQSRRMLIVLDNCEHVLPAAATIAVRLVEAKISSCLLATSREPLGVCGENLQRVEPLAIPERAKVRSASEAMLYPSVKLFALRAFEAADYRLIDSDAQATASLCEALDGLPLAIEIAAAKLDQFSPSELLNSLSRRLSELRNGNSTHSRHQTLWATLDWSYQLLSMQESTIFRLLSVFAGSFEWSDVAGMARLVQYDPYQITLALGGLVAKSLLSAETDGEQLRYRLLECTRSYAAERLLQDPLAQEAQRHHAQIVLSAFEKSETEWAWIDNHVWHARYEARIGDLRKALDWCFCDGGDASLGVDLAVSAIRLWNEQSSIFEQLSQVERALNHCASVTDAPLQKAKLATSRAWSMTLARQLHRETDDAWNIALGFAELSGNVGLHLSVMFGQAVYLIYTGRNEQAVTLLDDFNRIAARAGDRGSLFDGERLSALAEMHLGKLVDVRTKLERLAEELSHDLPPSRIARYQEERYVSIHSTLAFSTWLTCRPESALTMAEEMVMKTGQIGQLMGQSNILALVALPLALWSGKVDALERYSTMLRSNLDRENIAIWEPVHRFYDSVGRHARGSLNAIEDMRSAIDELVRDGFLVRTPMYLGVLAEALLSRGKSAEAYDALERALTLQSQSKEIWCLPELLRVKAQTMASLGERDLARVMLERAREIAFTMGARSLELRIVNDMAQAAIAEGNNMQAIELLEPLSASFGVGAATEDLKRSALLLTTAGANRNPIPPQM
jgi:predicted ATPase/DNA-binding winged helix-turn-helix (wHTH) protein